MRLMDILNYLTKKPSSVKLYKTHIVLFVKIKMN